MIRYTASLVWLSGGSWGVVVAWLHGLTWLIHYRNCVYILVETSTLPSALLDTSALLETIMKKIQQLQMKRFIKCFTVLTYWYVRCSYDCNHVKIKVQYVVAKHSMTALLEYFNAQIREFWLFTVQKSSAALPSIMLYMYNSIITLIRHFLLVVPVSCFPRILLPLIIICKKLTNQPE